MIRLKFLNSKLQTIYLLLIILILSSVCGFYYSPIRELRSFASARLDRLLIEPGQRRSHSPIPCNHPCKGVSGNNYFHYLNVLTFY